MAVEIVTKEDLELFRIQLLEEIKRLVKPEVRRKRWLRSREVRRLLKISAGTLQNLRVNDTLHPVQLPNSRILYYDAEEVENLLKST